MKRISMFILSVAILMSCCLVTFADTASDNSEKADRIVTEKIELLTKIGVVDDDLGNLNQGMAREDFAVCVAKMLNLDTSKTDVRYFNDVEKAGYAVGAINALFENGIISQPENKCFRPMDIIGVNEAMKIAVSILGYDAYAKVNGGYPTGYMLAGSKLDLDKNIDSSNFTKKDALCLLYNALHTEINNASGLTDEKYVFLQTDGKTLGSVYLSLDRFEGTINSTYGVSTDERYVAEENEIYLNGKKYVTEDGLDFSDLAGNYCYVWTKGATNSKDGIVIHASKVKIKTEDFITDALNFEKYESEAITFYDEDSGKEIKKKIETVNFIYNGMPLLTSYNSTLSNINKGEIILKDSDANGIYDMVMIWDYKNYVVGAVSGSKIYNKANPGEYFDYNEFDMKRAYLASGADLDFSEIAVGSILSVAKSNDDKTIRVISSLTEINAKAEKVDFSKGKVRLNGEEYLFDKSYLKMFIDENGSPEYNLIQATYFYKLDHMGNICYIETVPTAYKVGYLLKTCKSEENAFEEKFNIRIYNVNNKMEEFTGLEKLRVDGVKVKGYNEFIARIPNATSVDGAPCQMVLYTTGENGQLVSIDTTNFVQGKETEEGSLLQEYDGITNLWFNSQRLGVRSFVDGTVPVFYVPSGVEFPEAEDIYCGNTSFYMATDGQYKANVFRFGTANLTTGAVVCEYNIADLNLNIGNNNIVIMFDSAAQSVDEEGNHYWEVTGYSRGVRQTYKAPYEMDFSGLEHGDLIHFYYGVKGEIVSSKKTGRSDYVLLCKAKDIIENRNPGWNNHERYPSLYTAQTQAAYDYYRGSFQLSFGYVQKVVDNMVAWKWIVNDEFKSDKEHEYDEIAKITGGITVYDSSISGDNKISVGTTADINDYESSGNNCSMIIYQTGGGGYRGTYIYK